MEAANVENTKICTGCKIEMLATKEFFHAHKPSKDLLTPKCKKCLKAYKEKYYKKNSKKIKESQIKYNKKNSEKIKQYKEKYSKKNSEKIKKYYKKYYKRNSEKVKQQSKKWAKNNPEKIKESERKWRKNNPEKIKKISKEYIENLTDYYIAKLLKKPIKHLNPQVIETRRLIILIKRELRKNNFKTLETMQEDSTNKNNSQMENNLKENDNKRDLDFEVKNSDDLNKMLSGFLMDVRRGSVTHYSANSINLVADKINKNNCNQLEYKRLSGGDKKIDFFEDNK